MVATHATSPPPLYKRNKFRIGFNTSIPCWPTRLTQLLCWRCHTCKQTHIWCNPIRTMLLLIVCAGGCGIFSIQWEFCQQIHNAKVFNMSLKWKKKTFEYKELKSGKLFTASLTTFCATERKSHIYLTKGEFKNALHLCTIYFHSFLFSRMHSSCRRRMNLKTLTCLEKKGIMILCDNSKIEKLFT